MRLAGLAVLAVALVTAAVALQGFPDFSAEPPSYTSPVWFHLLYQQPGAEAPKARGAPAFTVSCDYAAFDAARFRSARFRRAFASFVLRSCKRCSGVPA